MITLIATVVIIFGILLLDENGHYSSNTTYKLIGFGLMIASTVALCVEWGTMRGIFVSLGLISVMGTFIPLLDIRLKKQS
ncbi:hypothetical protein ACFSJY_07595 [Thalassotalea euphylliae]|uniref:hypothetical protein n=1 Tax=Thalassotalea euphylliae TaxID=1655234 RepID=UPI00362DCBFE